jgi:hypothetical protein
MRKNWRVAVMEGLLVAFKGQKMCCVEKINPSPFPYLFLPFLITVCVLFHNSFGNTKAYAGETQKYHGQILSAGNPPGYETWGRTGTCLSVDDTGPTDCLFAIKSGEFIASNGNKLGVLWLVSNTKTRDTNGNIIWRAEDTLEFPFDLKGAFGDMDICSSTLYPDANIIALGEWINRIKPEVGGYIHPIEKAWRIDFSTRRFVEIPTSGVSCELNEDRN